MDRSKMARVALGLSCLLGVLALGCISSPEPRSSFPFESRRLGIRAELPGWSVYRIADEAPDELRPAFRGKRGLDESPLLVGRAQASPGLGVTLLVEPTEALGGVSFDDAVTRALQRPEMLASWDVLEGRGIRYAELAERGMLVVRTWSLLFPHRGRAYTLSVSSAIGDDFYPEFVQAAASIEVRTASGWAKPFAQLSAGVEQARVAREVFEQADAEVARGLEELECGPGERPLLYRVESEGAVLHLFGTMHVGHASLYPLDDPIEDAFAASDRLVVELDARDAAGLIEALGGSVETSPEEASPAGASPQEFLGRLDELDLPPEVSDALELLFTSSLLWMETLERHGLDEEQGVDGYFLDRAGDREIVELESLEEQLGLFGSLGEQLGLQSPGFSGLGTAGDLAALFAAWRCGDEEGLTDLVLGRVGAERAQQFELNRAIFGRRNERMTDKLVELLSRDGESFVAVGAGHLVGPEGIPTLLRSRGFSVVRR